MWGYKQEWKMQPQNDMQEADRNAFRIPSPGFSSSVKLNVLEKGWSPMPRTVKSSEVGVRPGRVPAPAFWRHSGGREGPRLAALSKWKRRREGCDAAVSSSAAQLTRQKETHFTCHCLQQHSFYWGKERSLFSGHTTLQGSFDFNTVFDKWCVNKFKQVYWS